MLSQPDIHYYYNTPYPASVPSVGQMHYPSPTISQYTNDTPSPVNFHSPSVSAYQVHQSQFLDSPTTEPAPRLSKPRPIKSEAQPRKFRIPHPYARLFAKKDETKRRKIWNHVLEKLIFSPYELSTLGAPQRRTIYITSLEAHIDRLHSQLEELGFWPVSHEDLEPFKGLNSKTAKSMVAGLQYDASISRLKLLELERANDDLQKMLFNFPLET
ncbi:hypothetical protein CPB84DRAFT_1759355 [Gymnopilus junonius]|uniref:Uncharacterized protein n=1 Tax=Gymnopilus junonius TaxID=109634 RepID=A0A9P5TU37_GYMJU|nr:hypothetical protein CPB84DRAFT_1759355 [Gymnopilus junonius]